VHDRGIKEVGGARPTARYVLQHSRTEPGGVETVKVKAYLDNNVVSSIGKDDTATESDSLDALMAAYDAGKVDLVTSELTLQEIRFRVRAASWWKGLSDYGRRSG